MGARPRRASARDILRRAFELIVERTDELAMLMSLEMGKSLVEARAEVAYANDFLRWFSEEAVRIRGSYTVSPNGRARLLTMRQPVGPCLLITPWNFPLAMGTRKIGPAIAAGCTMVVKPAKQTPLSMLALGDIFAEAGLPAGRAEHHHDLARRAPVTDPLFDDPRLRKMSFTGSTEVGRALAKRAMDRAAARLDGARRQRGAADLRRRRPRARRRPGDDGEDAQHGRGVHVGQPPLRAVRRRRGVLAPAWPRAWSSCASAAASSPTPTSAR